ncbi:MAG: permease [Acidobacteriota bacterium]
MLPRTTILHPARPSLLRAILLSLAAFAFSLRLGGFPDLAMLHASPWQLVPAVLALAGLGETMRCIRRRWDMYQAGILILLYSELMILAMAVFLFFYP